MEILNVKLELEHYLLWVPDRLAALKLLDELSQVDDKLPVVKMRSLSLETQIATFEVWGLPYHVHRNNQCHISDIESIRLTLSENASVELSMTLLDKTSTSVMVIGNAVLVELSTEPGEVYLLQKDYKDA